MEDENIFIQEERHTISAVSEMFKLNEETLRKYERDFSLIIPRDGMQRRYYTDKEVALLKQIIELKNNGLSKDAINKMLNKSLVAMEQKKNALETLTLDKVMFSEFKEELFKAVVGYMKVSEEALIEEVKSVVKTSIDSMRDEVKEEVRKEFEKQNEQSRAENQKLFKYLEDSRSKKKGFLGRLFGKE